MSPPGAGASGRGTTARDGARDDPGRVPLWVPSAVRRPPDEELARELIEEVLSDPHPVGEFLAEDLGEGAGLVYQREFTASLELRPKERPRTDDAKRDTWLVMMSQAVERDLGPFLELWGVPVSPEARGRVARYPEWLPEKRGAR